MTTSARMKLRPRLLRGHLPPLGRSSWPQWLQQTCCKDVRFRCWAALLKKRRMLLTIERWKECEDACPILQAGGRGSLPCAAVHRP